MNRWTSLGGGYICGLAFDAGGNLYVCRASDNIVSKIDPLGTVTTSRRG